MSKSGNLEIEKSRFTNKCPAPGKKKIRKPTHANLFQVDNMCFFVNLHMCHYIIAI